VKSNVSTVGLLERIKYTYSLGKLKIGKLYVDLIDFYSQVNNLTYLFILIISL